MEYELIERVAVLEDELLKVKKRSIALLLLGALIISLSIELFIVIVAFFAPMFHLINSM